MSCGCINKKQGRSSCHNSKWSILIFQEAHPLGRDLHNRPWTGKEWVWLMVLPTTHSHLFSMLLYFSLILLYLSLLLHASYIILVLLYLFSYFPTFFYFFQCSFFYASYILLFWFSLLSYFLILFVFISLVLYFLCTICSE